MATITEISQLSVFQQFPKHVAACVDSYLVPSTLREFIDHFRVFEKLVIPKGQPFSLSDSGLILGNDSEQFFPAGVVTILGSLLAPLGKSLTVNAEKFVGKASFDRKRGLSFTCTNSDLQLSANEQRVIFRISDLARLMYLYSMPKVLLEQPVQVIGFFRGEIKSLNWDGFQKVVANRWSGLFVTNLKGLTGNPTMKSQENEDGIQSIEFTSCRLQFSLQRIRHEYDSIERFVSHFDTFGEMVLQPNELVTVRDLRIRELAKGSENGVFLNQLMLGVGKTFPVLHTTKTSSCTSTVSHDTFTFSCRDDVVLKPQAGHLATTLPRLSGALQALSRDFRLVLQENQALDLYGISESELELFANAVKAKGGRNVSPQSNPSTLVWNVTCPGQMTLDSDTQFSRLTIRNGIGSEFILELASANQKEFAANLLRGVSSVFLEDILKQNTETIALLQLSIVLAYCYHDFRFYEKHRLPEFFSREERESMRKLMNDDVFVAARTQVLKTPEYRESIEKIETRNKGLENGVEMPDPVKKVINMVLAVSVCIDVEMFRNIALENLSNFTVDTINPKK